MVNSMLGKFVVCHLLKDDKDMILGPAGDHSLTDILYSEHGTHKLIMQLHLSVYSILSCVKTSYLAAEQPSQKLRLHYLIINFPNTEANSTQLVAS